MDAEQEQLTLQEIINEARIIELLNGKPPEFTIKFPGLSTELWLLNNTIRMARLNWLRASSNSFLGMTRMQSATGN